MSKNFLQWVNIQANALKDNTIIAFAETRFGRFEIRRDHTNWQTLLIDGEEIDGGSDVKSTAESFFNMKIEAWRGRRFEAALAAMQGILAHPDDCEDIAGQAVTIADALLARLEITERHTL